MSLVAQRARLVARATASEKSLSLTPRSAASVDACASALSMCRLSSPTSRIEAQSVFPIGVCGNRFLSSLPSPQDEGEIVTFLTLNNIRDNPGAVKKKRRIGRGVGCSKGKTCGRGHKGQKARSGGGVKPTFEGGQTPFYKRVPKRGFRNIHAQPMTPINVGTLQDFVDMGRIVPPGPSDPPLTIPDFIKAGILTKSSVKHGVKLLAKGSDRFKTPLRMEVSRASKSAIDAVEEVGGEVVTVHYNRLALKALIKPHRFDIIPRRALPPPKMMPYYTNYDHRGYLSPEVQMRKVLARMEKEVDSKNKG